MKITKCGTIDLGGLKVDVAAGDNAATLIEKFKTAADAQKLPLGQRSRMRVQLGAAIRGILGGATPAQVSQV